jgi:opacity protein-like surface antigen
MMPTEAPSYSPMGQPYYQPAYQPIPGVPAPPGFYSEAVPPCCSPMVVDGPPDFSGGVVVPQDSVYSNVVGDCSTCQTSGQACCSGCPDFYFSFFGGYTSLRDMEGQSNGGIIQADSGSGFGFALGRRNSRNLRTELELSFRENDLTGILFGNTSQPFSGELNSFSGMANAYWEFVDVRTCCLKPYFGAGIGFVSFDSSATDSFGQSLIVPGAENDTSFAFQWMAGINYKAYRNMDLFAEYRFFQATTFRVDSTVAGVSDRYEFETDNVFVGFRWKF